MQAKLYAYGYGAEERSTNEALEIFGNVWAG